jgi:hypothetical protein
MPLLDVQRRGQQIGRIRIGELVSTGKKDSEGRDKMRPSRLSTFRFTTASRASADAIAALYGGEVRDWERGQFEVITSESAITVMVPPRDQVVSQWYEMWTGGGCQRRCDSRVEQLTGKPCLCPHAEDPANADEVAAMALNRAELAKLNPPQACKPVTRINVMIPDLPGVGVFRLDTHSYYAAVEIGDAAALLQAARDHGVFMPAVLRIEQRQRVAGGQTKNYPVPVLEVLATFRQIASGELEAGGITAQLPPAPGEPMRAIAAAPSAPAAPAPAPAATADTDVSDHEAADEAYRNAQAIWDEASQCRDPGRFQALAARADGAALADEYVCTDRVSDTWEPLKPALQDLWRERAHGQDRRTA